MQDTRSEACSGSDICLRIKCSPSHRRETLFPVSVPFPQLHSSRRARHPPYMIHEAHSSSIRWHDTHPTTVPWNHASWSCDPSTCHSPSFVTLLCRPPSPAHSLIFAPDTRLLLDLRATDGHVTLWPQPHWHFVIPRRNKIIPRFLSILSVRFH